LIAEGPVSYWQKQGFGRSTDGTCEVLDNFPDPENKIKIVHSQYSERNEQCNAYMKYLSNDADYIWNLDCDEIFKPEAIETVMQLLTDHKYTSAAFRSLSFFGGLDHFLSGFELDAEFIRIRKVYPGSYWATHRPPTIAHVDKHARIYPPDRRLTKEILADHGVNMYHYSYVFPDQVKQKTTYYKSELTKENGIDDYFNKVWLPWVKGDEESRITIEKEYEGVHDFKPSYRGECYPKPFIGKHPKIIIDTQQQIEEKIRVQLERCVEK
jgi:hypothetical protein